MTQWMIVIPPGAIDYVTQIPSIIHGTLPFKVFVRAVRESLKNGGCLDAPLPELNGKILLLKKAHTLGKERTKQKLSGKLLPGG